MTYANYEAGQIRAVPRPRPRAHVPRRAPNPRVADAIAALSGLGFGITLALAVSAESASALSAPGGIATAIGRLAGLTGGYGMIMVLLLAARLPPLERVVGQDRLIAWHRTLAPWTIAAIAAHGVLITIGYAEAAQTGVLHQFDVLLLTYSWILPATAGFVLLMAAGLTSHRIARRLMSHESWWVVHLYTYLGLSLAFMHQITTGASFVGHPLATAWWTALWVGATLAVITFRIAIPAARSLRHDLRVLGVKREAPGVISVILEGRDLDRLPMSGGQFVQWRFLTRGQWWQAHPYSLSSMPRKNRLRITVKDLGDHSSGLARVRPGTRVFFEGPYGAFTPHATTNDRVLLIGAGVGAALLPPLLEDLAPGTDAVVVQRASSTEDLVLREEIALLVDRRRGSLHELVGSRRSTAMTGRTLLSLVPDLAQRDVFVCGPPGLNQAVVAAATAVGVPRDRIHFESFSL